MEGKWWREMVEGQMMKKTWRKGTWWREICVNDAEWREITVKGAWWREMVEGKLMKKIWLKGT